MRTDQFAVTVAVDDTPLGVFDTWDGGDTSAEEIKYKPGGMSPQKSLGGSATTDNVTVARLYELARDHDLARWLRSRVGKGAVTASKQPLDVDGNPWGKPEVITGKLQRVTTPNHDSEDNGAARFELEISTEGTVG